MDAKFVQAYTQAQYRIHEPNILFGVGLISKELSQHLVKIKCTCFAFITAYNPYSKVLSVEENKERNGLLLVDLNEYMTIPWAWGDRSGEREPEDSFLVCNIFKDQIIQLAQKYEQNAILYRDGGESVEIIDTQV